MDYQEYNRRKQLIADLTQAARFREAEDAIYQLIMSDISDLDKAEMCAQIADVYDRMGRTEDALIWFDKGMTYEQGYSRFEVATKKAEYLSQLGRQNAAIEIFEGLLRQSFVREDDKEHLRKTIQALLGKSLHGWQ